MSGTALAIDMSLFSGVRMLAPAIGGYLLATVGPASITTTAAGLEAALLVLLYAGVVKIGGIAAGYQDLRRTKQS